jgi:hypothetical protein
VTFPHVFCRNRGIRCPESSTWGALNIDPLLKADMNKIYDLIVQEIEGLKEKMQQCEGQFEKQDKKIQSLVQSNTQVEQARS